MRGIGSGLAAALVLVAATAVAAEPEVRVLRGRGSPPPRAVAENPPPARAFAGERLWILDESSGKLAACRLERTSRVGELRIRCAERRLAPKGS
jgi:hypothetical protein